MTSLEIGHVITQKHSHNNNIKYRSMMTDMQVVACKLFLDKLLKGIKQCPLNSYQQEAMKITSLIATVMVIV